MNESIEVILDSCVSTIKWINANEHAEFEYKLKENEKICKPIIDKIYNMQSPNKSIVN